MVQGGGGSFPGIKQLLARLGLPGGAKGVEVSGMKKEGAEGIAEGEAMGPDGLLLAGLGFSEADGRSSLRNRSEMENLREFLRMAADPESGPESKLGRGKGAEGKEGPADGRKAGSEGRGAETAERGAERTERADRGAERAAGDEALPAESKHETERADAREGATRWEEDRNEEDKPGAGWWAEEVEEEDKEDRKGGSADVFAHEHRCRARLPDGTRCLHRPVEGQPYCTVHRTGQLAGPR